MAKRYWWAVMGAISILVLSFQNCSDFSLQDQIMYEQALLESREALDAELIPKLTTASELRRWYKTTNTNYVNLATSGNQISLVLVIPRSATGTVYSVRTGAGDQEAAIQIASGKIQAIRSNSVGTTYSETLTGDLPASGEDVVIAASFGAKAGELRLLINGRVQSSALVTVGTPGDFTTATKILNSSGTFSEYMVFVGDSATSATAGKLSLAELNVLSRYLADSLSVPDVIFDPVVVGGSADDAEDDDGGGTRFLAAKAIFDAKCLSCHAGLYSPNLANLTETKAVNSGWVLKGDSVNSLLYYRLKGSLGGVGNKNMPDSGGTISAGEVQTIADWIDNIP